MNVVSRPFIDGSYNFRLLGDTLDQYDDWLDLLSLLKSEEEAIEPVKASPLVVNEKAKAELQGSHGT